MWQTSSAAATDSNPHGTVDNQTSIEYGTMQLESHDKLLEDALGKVGMALLNGFQWRDGIQAKWDIQNAGDGQVMIQGLYRKE